MLVSFKYIACIYLILNVVKAGIIAVGYDYITFSLECIHIIYHWATEKGLAIFQSRLIDDNLCTS